MIYLLNPKKDFDAVFTDRLMSSQKEFITSCGGFIALEMISDAITVSQNIKLRPI
jgi:hypothetical protein